MSVLLEFPLIAPRIGVEMCRSAKVRNLGGSVSFLRPLVLGLALTAIGAQAAEQRVVAPQNGLAAITSDAQGLSTRVEIDGKTVLKKSPLGLEFEGGARLGPAAAI